MTLLEVLEEHPGVVHRQLPIREGGYFVVGVEVEKVLRRTRRIDVDDIDIEGFLGKNNPHRMTARVILAGVENQ